MNREEWLGRKGELCVWREQLVERNQMKGKKPEAGEEQGWGKGEGKAGGLVVLRDFSRRKLGLGEMEICGK